MIKVDQLRATIERAYDRHSLAAIGKVVSRETVETLARQLAALHVPARVDWAARFGLPPEPPPPALAAAAPPPTARPDPTPARGPATDSAAGPRPVCATCGRRVSATVVAYCQSNAARFGSAVYCIDCQKRVDRARA